MKIKTALCLSLLCLLFCLTARAASLPIYFTDANMDEQHECEQIVNRVEIKTISKRNYLFLPAGWDSSSLRIHITSGKTLGFRRSDGQEIQLADGDVTDIFCTSGKVDVYSQSGKRIGGINVLQGSLPTIFVQTESNSVKAIHKSKENSEKGAIHMINEQGGAIHSGGLRGFRLRGNTTATYTKKPYQMKLERTDELITGAGKARTWVLLADYIDLSLLRNRITLNLAQAVGIPFSASSCHVDLYVNGRYSGVYLLCEKVQVNENRVNITEQDDEMERLNGLESLSDHPYVVKKNRDAILYAAYQIPENPKDITGGYLLNVDKLFRVKKMKDDSYVMTNHRQSVVIVSPDVSSVEQAEYVYDFLNTFERAIYARDGIDPETGKHYSEIIDVDSFALKYILEDFSANFDAASGSQYFFKDSDAVDGKLYAGPAWDYDLTYSGVNMIMAKAAYLDRPKFSGTWWQVMFSRHSDFRQRVSELYKERYMPALEVLTGRKEPEEGSSLRSIMDYADEIQASANMNFKFYGRAAAFHPAAGTNHNESVNVLQTYVSKRTDAMLEYYEQKAAQ